MPVSSSTEHWIKPDALTINLNHFGDPDYLQVSVLAGAVVMAFKQDVIGYNAAHNYRTWPLEAANTYLETSSAYNVYARLTRSEVNARALVIYDPILRDVEGREITYEKNEETGEVKEILGEPNENFYYIFLGQLSSSISEDGRSVLREWTSEYRSGSLETNEQENDWMVILNKMFRPHYDDPLNPDTLTWIEAKAHMGIAGGLTSFIYNGSLKLPSIYDGLPIDNQTLYWEVVTEQVGTDEEGNPVYETTKVLKAAGGGSGGGVADSVHWDNIEGKPNFDDYATQDNLKDYLPLSGGTMTGKITLPVGIGTPSLDWGENGSLGGIWVSSTGIFQIIAESEFRVLTNVDGVSTRQFGISNAGNMGVTGTLLVGKGGYLTNSQFKFYVYDGDAFIDGMLAVDGNVNPNIPSMYNIGDSSKRFACVYADSVDVGGVKISLLQDGVLLIDGNLAVTGGITSYVDGGDLDLPSIYDGLPIDGDTLYWVLDDNGKKVMLKSKGGNDEGGGSVNDGQFFANGGWIGSDANSVIFGSYLYGGVAANTPSSSGQLLAFNNGDLDSWNRGSQIFIDGEKFYYRQFWDNYWRNWRRVISENADGVIDYDLTLGGSLNMPSGYSQIKCGENALLVSYSGSTDTYLYGNEHLYLMSKNIFAFEGSEEIYRILHEGNYRNYDYTAKWLSVVDIRNTTPKPSDLGERAITAQFTNTDNPGDGWFSGLSIQGWTNDYKAWQLRSGAWDFASDHLYFRNGELETWNDWRRVITGDVDGVIDYDLKVHGNIVVDTDNLSAIDVSHRSSSLWNFALTSFNPIMPDGSLEIIEFGKGQSAYNAGSIGFKYFGDSSPNNMMTISLFNSDEILNITGHRKVGINTTTPSYDLEVNGQVGVNGDLRLKGGLIQYNEEDGYFYLEGNLVVSGGISSYVDVGNLNLPSIYDGLPLDMDTLGWKEVTDASGAKSKVLSVIGGIDESILWSDIEGIPSWIESSKPSYSYSEINDTPDLTKYALKENIPSLSGYATQAWVEKQGYAKSSDIPNLDGYAKLTHLSDYLPLSGVLPSSEFTLQGDLRLQKGNGTSGRKLFFGDGYNAYLYESPNNFLNIYADSGVKIYDNTTNFKEYIEMTRSGITLSTTSSSYISMVGMGIKVNDGVITYNKSGRYFELDGNLLVTGGITAFADSGAGNQWILDASALSGVTSTNQYKVYSARVTKLLKDEVDKIADKIDEIQDAFSKLSSSSSASAIGSALNTLAGKL